MTVEVFAALVMITSTSRTVVADACPELFRRLVSVSFTLSTVAVLGIAMLLATDAPTVRVIVRVSESPVARSPIVQTPLVELYVVVPLPEPETKVTPAGRLDASTSEIDTPDASDGPRFCAVTVKTKLPVPLPAVIVALFTIFVTKISTLRLTFVVIVLVSFPWTASISVSLIVASEAVFEISRVSDVVAPTVSVTVNVALSPAARLPIFQMPVVVLKVLPPDPTADTNVTPAGRLAVMTPVSLTVTPVASAEPPLVAVIV